MRTLTVERRKKVALMSEEASEWFTRLKDDGLTGTEQEEYLQWLRASPDHIAEALRMGRVYTLLCRFGIDGSVSEAEISNVIALAPQYETEAAHEPPPKPGWNWRSWAIAATLPLLLIGTLLIVLMQLGWFGGDIKTDASEWRRFRLADGSIVRAGPQTRLRIQFDERQRLIGLPYGEALFQVAKDPARPFYVTADAAVVRAVGTEFGVSRKNGKILVTVAEGLVSVSQLRRQSSWFGSDDTPGEIAGGGKSVSVSAGEQAAVPKTGPVTVQRVNVKKELAWAQGRLIFESRTTVAEAIEEFNKRNHVQIAVEDSAIASRPVRGVFDAADPESFAQLIAKRTHALIVRDKPGVLFLQPQEEASDDEGDDGGTALPPISADTQPPDESPTGPSETRTSDAL